MLQFLHKSSFLYYMYSSLVCELFLSFITVEFGWIKGLWWSCTRFCFWGHDNVFLHNNQPPTITINIHQSLDNHPTINLPQWSQHNQELPTKLIPLTINIQQSISLQIAITQLVELPQLSQYKQDQFIEAFYQTLGNPTILLTKVWEIFTF